jgi:hypothetical protein
VATLRHQFHQIPLAVRPFDLTKVGASKVLFGTPNSQLMAFSTLWDIAPDGNRFLFSTPATVGDAPQPPLTVVLNWTALLKE